MSTRNWIAFILILISLLLLYPGLIKPMLSIEIGTKVPLLGEISLYQSTQSILQTIKTLHQNNNRLVAFLILFFSVVVPIIKAILLLIVLMFKELKYRMSMYKFVSLIGKWSMADVFVVGVFLAFLATQSNDSINAEVHEGFYYFLAYCLVSLVAVQVIDISKDQNTISTN